MAPGSLEGLQLVVDDADAAHAELDRARRSTSATVEDQPWGRFVYFKDPDGNSWNVQRSDAARTADAVRRGRGPAAGRCPLPPPSSRGTR